jgi:hypothetical protein
VFGDSQGSAAIPGGGSDPAQQPKHSDLAFGEQLRRVTFSGDRELAVNHCSPARSRIDPGPATDRPQTVPHVCQPGPTRGPVEKEPGPVVGHIEVQQPFVICQPDRYLRGAPRLLGAILQSLEAATGGSAADRGFSIELARAAP